jgi:hypothetical protein
VESIQKVVEPTSKKDVQKLLSKINWLRWFISNLARKVESFLPLIRLKHDERFISGAEQKIALKRIKAYLTTPLILRAPRISEAFKIYIDAQDHVIGTMLLQEESGKEYPMAYISRRLLDAETRYVFVGKLCLATYYACT